jgi:trehalose utilization protein
MISTDFYEGIRKARPTDLEAIQVNWWAGQQLLRSGASYCSICC